MGLAAAPSCDGGRYPTGAAPRVLVVHGMLATGAPEQQLVLEYSRGIDEGVYRGLTPASGAAVTVSAGQAHPFQEDPRRPGVYRAAFTPVAGERYLLRIQGPAGEVVQGEAVAPGRPDMLAPAADTTVPLGGYATLRWTSAPHAAAYVLVEGVPGQPGTPGALLHPAILAGTSLTLQPGAFGGTSFTFRVAAVDANYVAYAGADPAGPRVRSTVQGGYGVFGAYALGDPRSIRVR